MGAALVGWQRFLVVGSGVRPVGTDGGISALDLGVAGFELAGVEVVHLQRLLEDEEMLRAPGAGQGLGNLVFVFVAAIVAQGGQFVGITLAGDNRPDDAQTGVAGGVGDGLIEADVHVDERLLHVQDVRRAVLDELSAVAQQGAQGNQVGVGAKGFGEQPQAVQSLDPLTVEDIGLMAGGEAAGQVAADQAAMDAAAFQHLEEGDPVDAGGFHGDRLDAVLDQPIGDGAEIGGVGAEGTHDLGLVGAGNADIDFLSADVGAGSVGVDDRQPFGGADFPLSEGPGMGLGTRHRNLLR